MLDNTLIYPVVYDTSVDDIVRRGLVDLSVTAPIMHQQSADLCAVGENEILCQYQAPLAITVAVQILSQVTGGTCCVFFNIRSKAQLDSCLKRRRHG